MDGDMTNIYGGGLWTSFLGSMLGYTLGLLVLVGGFILISRYLIGRRVERFEKEWRASQGLDPEVPPETDHGEESKPPPSNW